jgi:acetyl esterase/lipase
MLATLRFLKQQLRPSAGAVDAHESEYAREGERLPATVYRPHRGQGTLPGWVLLHGLTYTGREHPSLVAFARSLAASGALVLVPDIPEWRALRMVPEVSVATIRAAIISLTERPDVARGRTGVVGFSFGATQALIAASDPAIARRLRGLAAWGGYCDVGRLFHFAVTGDHELDGHHYHAEPDPYGRWVVGANYLTCVPGHEGETEVADALLQLAEDAGRRQIFAADPIYDAIKARIRTELPEAMRATFDLFAPPAGTTPDLAAMVGLAQDLAGAAMREDPLIDPAPYLGRLRVRTLIAHARDDRLVPFTEGLRLCRALPSEVVRMCETLSLFSHSGGPHEGLGPLDRVRETIRFAKVLSALVGLI